MDIERETMIEIGVSVGAVAVMIVTMMAIGAAYSTDGGLSQQGGKVLVGAIAFFILLMAGVGYVLAIRVTGEDGESNDAANSA